MTIASTNVSFSAIIAEKNAAVRPGGALGSSNVSLKSLSGKEVKQQNVAGTGAGSTYALAKETWTYGRDASRTSGTVVAAQGTGSAGLNTTPFGLSEWIGYDPQQSRIGHWQYPVIQHSTTQTGAGCFAVALGEVHIWCTKSGSTISFFGSSGSASSGYGAPKKQHSDGTITTLTLSTLGTLTTNTSNMLPTGCTMSYEPYVNSSSGSCLGTGGSVGTIPSGSTSTTNIGSGKIGYKVLVSGICEGFDGQTGNKQFIVGVRFNWTWPTSPSGETYEPSFTEIVVRASSTIQHADGFDAC